MIPFQYRYLGIGVTVTSIYSMSFLFPKTFCVLSPKQSKPKLDLAKIDRSTTVRTRCVRISPFVKDKLRIDFRDVLGYMCALSLL